MIGQIYDVTPVNSDEDLVTNGTVCTELSDEEAYLSEESDLEDQLGFFLNQDLPTSSELEEKSRFSREIKVNTYCGDVMYPSYKGLLISSDNVSEKERTLHGDFGGEYYSAKDNTLLNMDLIAVVADDEKINDEEKDVGTRLDSSEL